MAAIVVQFGLAMIPFAGRIASSGLTSETTNGTSGSIRHAEELSITTPPAAATLGAMIREACLPMEKSARSRPAEIRGFGVLHEDLVIPQGKDRPAERADAKNRSSLIGNRRSSSTRRMTPPTCPVAPKTPTRMPTSLSPYRRPPFSIPGRRLRW